MVNGLQITLLVVVVAIVAAFIIGRPHQQTSNVDLSTLRPGPIRHAQLPDDLIARVRAFEPVFADIYPNTHEQWLEGFQRDLHPENEIAIWENIAAALTQFIAGRDLPLELRKEALGILLVRSAGTD